MKQGITLTVFIGTLLMLAWFASNPSFESRNDGAGLTPVGEQVPAQDTPPSPGESGKGVLDISVHTVDDLEVLLERAEQFALTPPARGEGPGLVLVLHGPEVEFFSIRNYDKYKDIVDKAARLDAFAIVDVKICQTMMERRGIERDDIPAFIEQVPNGPAEIEKLLEEGYVRF